MASTRTEGHADPAAELTLGCRHELAPAERDAVRALHLSPRQVDFAGTTTAAIAACEAADPDRVRGLALRAQARVVGFAVLKRAQAAPAWAPPGAAVVSGLRVDAARQGRGLGTAALRALASWVRAHWPECVAVALRVDGGNAAAIRAYAKAGWVETGERRQGRVDLERTLTLALR